MFRSSSIALAFLIACAPIMVRAAGDKQTRTAPTSVLGTPVNTYLNINNISTVLWGNGWADNDEYDANSGFVFPKGSGKTAVFKSGFLWGAKVSAAPQIRVGGSVYRTGLQPGKILPNGIAEDPNLAKNRIYRVRPDYRTADLSSETNDERKTAAEIRTQYERDWNEWPVADGAPFDDRNLNGIYEPTIDMPGIMGAGQTIWFVCNDLDSLLTTNLYGSPPLGVELQVTMWAYSRPGAIGNTLFKKYLFINRNTVTFDSMYVSQWSDVDIGDARDDFAGCDTALSMGYCYNARSLDPTYDPIPPPSVGFRLLQGPIVPLQGGSAIFKGVVRQNYVNLRMTAFFYQNGGSLESPDPVQGSYLGTLQMYNSMKGFIGRTEAPQIDPQGNQTKFALAGDPLTGTGWVDGLNLPAGDRRICLASGPFTMSPGDSQEVVVAEIAGLGTGNLSSITEMKSSARIARQVYDGFFKILPPNPVIDVAFSSPQSTRLHIISDAKGIGASTMTALLKTGNGFTVFTTQLYDDGAHGDDAANDGIFGVIASIAPQNEGMYCDMDVTYSNGASASWQRLADHITTLGPVRISGPAIVSDNFNSDGKVNPGENIRFICTITNGSLTPLLNIRIYSTPADRMNSVTISNIAAQSALTLSYVPGDPSTYFSFDATYLTPPEIRLQFSIEDTHNNVWLDSVVFPAQSLRYPILSTPVTRTNGIGDGEFTVSIVDRAAVKSHQYTIHVVDSINASGERGIILKDSTDGRILLQNHPLPDSLGHLVPVTDGFKILLTGIARDGGMKDWDIPNGTRRFTFNSADSLELDGFEGAIGWEDPAHYFGNSQAKAVPATSLHNVLFKLAQASSDTAGNGINPYSKWNRETTTDTNMSYAYRYLQNANLSAARSEFAQYIVNSSTGFAYQDYKKGVPFSAWNGDVTPPQRLAVGFLENNVVNGLVDGKWWPPVLTTQQNTNATGPREWFFVFNRPYSGSVSDTLLQKDILNYSLPVMWTGTVNRRTSEDFSPGTSGDDQFLIAARHFLTSQDNWTFSLDSIAHNFVPASYGLKQNFPNPFNPTTTISYQLPFESRVTIKVYNLLGQEIATLVNTEQILGFYSVQWNSTNASGNSVASGVYFYRIETRGIAGQSGSFSQVKKMLLLR